ncbi:MAG: radical SAM protein, partial [Eubacteriales bacterium]|nr:radical SAM protein [Eubacteriales bacterium]
METGLQFVPAKTLLSGYAENNNWFGMHYNMNIYRGCCHGCIYCDSRSECYGVEQFDTVRAKKNALTILDGELRTKRKRGVVGTGAMSDPYNPFEQKAELTRGALKLMAKYGYGVGIATKS